MATIKQLITSLLLAHLNALKSQLDVVREKSPELSSINCQYLFPLFVSVFTPLYGTIALEYETVGKIEWRSLITSPYPYTHQIGASSYMNQHDFAFLLDLIACACIYTCLAFQPNIEENFRPYQDKNGQHLIIGKKVLSRAESNQMNSFSGRVKLSVYCILTSVYLACLCYFMYRVWINSVYTLTLHSVVFWLLVFPLYWFYLLYVIYASVVVVIMLSKFVQIQQQTILHQLNENNSNFAQRKPPVGLSAYYWRKHLTLNHSALNICAQIRAYSRHCSPLLTVILPYYIGLLCYLMYIVFVDQSTAFIEKQPYIYGMIGIALLLFGITYHCAKVVKFNQRIVSANRTFCLKMFTSGKNSFSQSQLLKAELLQTPRLMHKYAFCLESVCYRITMNTFTVIISYISVYFLLLVKRQYKQINNIDILY